VTAAATGSTSLPLSDRNDSWDAGAAQKSLDPGQYADAHFWRDSSKPADEIGSYKLPFARSSGGKLTAVWGGVTAAAQRLSQTDIPSGDVAGVKRKIGSYYSKAAKQYDDADIKVPWEADAQTAALGEVDSPDVGQPTIVAPPEPSTNAGQLRWEAIFFPEGEPTDDGRVMDPGAVDWRDLPLSLMAMTETGPGGHQGAAIAGRIDNIWREGDLVMGSGIFDDSEFGSEIARLVDDRATRTPSRPNPTCSIY
jgi:hypothetical protein